MEAGIEADHEAPVVGLVEGTGVPAYRFTAPDRVVVPSQDIVGKLGFPGSAGWVAYAGNEATMTQSFAVQAGAEYPDRGSPLEVWLEHPLPLITTGTGAVLIGDWGTGIIYRITAD